MTVVTVLVYFVTALAVSMIIGTAIMGMLFGGALLTGGIS
jgi:ribulose 1,5-bisphosphate synthetase/thiazole synthase